MKTDYEHFTAGPWSYSGCDNNIMARDGHERITVAVVTRPEDVVLIAQAPALLSALENVLRYLVTPNGFSDKGKGRTDIQQSVFDEARAVLASVKERQ